MHDHPWTLEPFKEDPVYVGLGSKVGWPRTIVISGALDQCEHKVKRFQPALQADHTTLENENNFRDFVKVMLITGALYPSLLHKRVNKTAFATRAAPKTYKSSKQLHQTPYI